MGFKNFYQTWFDDLHRLVDQLSSSPKPSISPDKETTLVASVHEVVSHYTEYYRVKQLVARQDILTLFSSPWSSSLERSLHWVAGWRPTTLFHLMYTQSSILFESRLVDILHGIRIGDLGDLTPSQFSRVSELQCETVQEENAISDELSEWQDGANDLVGVFCCGNSDLVEEKIKRLVSIVEKADKLRLSTIMKVVEVLTPQQAVEFLIATAELQFGVRKWGLNHDHEHRNL